jgi:hypothetical protein
MTEQAKIGTWATRFGWAMMAHAAVFMLVTALIAVPPALSELGVKSFEPSIGKIIAGGSAGTWFIMGYVFYFLVGVLAVGMFAMGYYACESVLGLRLEGRWKALAWTNFVALNAGVAASAYILMYAGYFGGAMVAAKASYPETHAFLAPLGTYAGISVLVMVVGVLAGLAIAAFKLRELGQAFAPGMLVRRVPAAAVA